MRLQSCVHFVDHCIKAGAFSRRTDGDCFATGFNEQFLSVCFPCLPCFFAVFDGGEVLEEQTIRSGPPCKLAHAGYRQRCFAYFAVCRFEGSRSKGLENICVQVLGLRVNIHVATKAPLPLAPAIFNTIASNFWMISRGGFDFCVTNSLLAVPVRIPTIEPLSQAHSIATMTDAVGTAAHLALASRHRVLMRIAMNISATVVDE